jgi:hypothetical protein
MKDLLALMGFDVKNLIKKRIYCIVCKIFVSNMASEMLKFYIFTTKICKTAFVNIMLL